MAQHVDRLGHRQSENVGNGETLQADFQRLTIVAPPAADVAGDEDVGQEMHFDRDHALPRARLAASPLHVERESPGPVAAGAGFGELGKQLPDRTERARVGRRVRTGGPADRRLTDLDDLVDHLPAGERVMRPRLLPAAAETLGECAVEGVDDERALARARDAGHAGHRAEGDIDVEALQVVPACSSDADRPAAATPTLWRHGNLLQAGQIPPGQGRRVEHHVGR